MSTGMIKARLVCAPSSSKALVEALASRGIAVSDEAGVVIAERGIRAARGGDMHLFRSRLSRIAPVLPGFRQEPTRKETEHHRREEGRSLPSFACREDSVFRGRRQYHLLPRGRTTLRSARKTVRARSAPSGEILSSHQQVVHRQRGMDTGHPPRLRRKAHLAPQGELRRNSKSRGIMSAISKPFWVCRDYRRVA